MIRKEPKLCHTEPLGEVSNPTCHTERSEVSHNTESKRDFSHSLKMTKGKQLSMTTAYKHSGIEWLGEIPKHWEIVKFKYIFKERSIKGFGHEQQLASTQNYGVIPKSLYPTRTVEALTSDLNFFKLVRKNNFVISLRSFEGGIEYSQYQGIISPAYTILESTNNIEHSYFQFLFKSSIFISALQIYKTGIREGQNISYLELQQDFLPLPPLQEQKAIAEFLDKKCDKISQFIESKQKLITLLQEKKQALINEAVTKGLNPNIEFKNSNIEYLGEIPHHWEVARSGLIYKNISSGTTPQSDNDEYCKNGNIFWINSGDLNDSVLTNSKNKITQKAIMAYSALKISPKGSLIIAMYGATIGKVSILGIDACTNQACCVLCESKYLNTRFVFYYFIAKRQDLISMAYGGGQPNISQDIIKNFKIPLPPLQEQKAIAEFLDTQITKIDLAIEKTKEQITLIKEYKTSLINQAVCGRIQLKD